MSTDQDKPTQNCIPLIIARRKEVTVAAHVSCVSYSPDQRLVATLAYPHLDVYDISDGKLVHSYTTTPIKEKAPHQRTERGFLRWRPDPETSGRLSILVWWGPNAHLELIDLDTMPEAPIKRYKKNRDEFEHVQDMQWHTDSTRFYVHSGKDVFAFHWENERPVAVFTDKCLLQCVWHPHDHNRLIAHRSLWTVEPEDCYSTSYPIRVEEMRTWHIPVDDDNSAERKELHIVLTGGTVQCMSWSNSGHMLAVMEVQTGGSVLSTMKLYSPDGSLIRQIQMGYTGTDFRHGWTSGGRYIMGMDCRRIYSIDSQEGTLRKLERPVSNPTTISRSGRQMITVINPSIFAGKEREPPHLHLMSLPDPAGDPSDDDKHPGYTTTDPLSD